MAETPNTEWIIDFIRGMTERQEDVLYRMIHQGDFILSLEEEEFLLSVAEMQDEENYQEEEE